MLQLEDNNKEIKDKESEQTKKTTKILKNYKIIEKPEKLENLITDEEKPKSEDETPKIQKKMNKNINNEASGIIVNMPLVDSVDDINIIKKSIRKNMRPEKMMKE